MPSENATAAVKCTDLVDEFASVADIESFGADVRGHVEQCLRCQAEMAHYRQMRRVLGSLAHDQFPADPAFEQRILLALDHEDGRFIHRVPTRAAAKFGGLAAAAGVIALAARHRRLAS